MKYKHYKSILTDEQYRTAERLARLIRDIDNGQRVDPVEKEMLYSEGNVILSVAVAINHQKQYEK